MFSHLVLYPPISPSALWAWPPLSPEVSLNLHCLTTNDRFQTYCEIKLIIPLFILCKENCFTGWSKCVNNGYLAAVRIVCNKGSQKLDGILHCVYGLVHESAHGKLHYFAVPAQRKGLTQKAPLLHLSFNNEHLQIHHNPRDLLCCWQCVHRLAARVPGHVSAHHGDAPAACQRSGRGRLFQIHPVHRHIGLERGFRPAPRTRPHA